MKRAFPLSLVLFIMVSILVLPVQAASNSYQECEIVYTESGDFEIETTIIIYPPMFRSNSKNADVVSSVKYSGKVIAEVTLSATFGYDGKTAWVSSASASHTTYDGWSYSNENISRSGGTVSLSAKVTHLIYGNHDINLSLTCSPTGQIS